MNGLFALFFVGMMVYFSVKLFLGWLGFSRNTDGEIQHSHITSFVTAGVILFFLGLVNWFGLLAGFGVFFLIWLVIEGIRLAFNTL